MEFHILVIEIKLGDLNEKVLGYIGNLMPNHVIDIFRLLNLKVVKIVEGELTPEGNEKSAATAALFLN